MKGFASRGACGTGWQLTAFDVERGCELTTRGLRGCAKVPDFLKFAAASAEALWQKVEDKLGAPIEAARAGGMQASHPHVDVLKDAIALHFVRSPRYLEIHQSSAIDSSVYVRREIPYLRADLLAEEFYRRHGFHAGGVEALQTVLEKPLAAWKELIDSGALARVSMEMMFERVRAILEPLSLEILHTPVGHGLLISDAPAFTFRIGTQSGITGVNMAINDSHGIALPLARDCIAVVGPEFQQGEITSAAVDMFNSIQVQIARRQVCYHPDGSLREFAESASHAFRAGY